MRRTELRILDRIGPHWKAALGNQLLGFLNRNPHQPAPLVDPSVPLQQLVRALTNLPLFEADK